MRLITYMGNISFQENGLIYVLIGYKTGAKLWSFLNNDIPYLGYFYKKRSLPSVKLSVISIKNEVMTFGVHLDKVIVISYSNQRSS